MLIGALALTSVAAEAPPAAVMPLSEVTPGLRGRGWSVFSGQEPEPFDVEVLGVWQMVNPDSSYILARLSGRGLEETGVIAGMSGSPVYVGDRLLGAVAFSWSFASDAIAGVTPIESMREMTSAAASPTQPAASSALDLLDLVRPSRAREHLVSELSRLAGGGRGAGGLLWSGTGFGAEAESVLREAVGPIVAAGSAPRLDSDLGPGDAVAAVLIDGDFRLAATGTVTDRLGDTVLAFGHPFLSLGDVAVPMAAAEIITVVPSLANSFKVGNIGPTLGSFDRDRPSGVRGVVGVLPAMLPLSIRVVGETERSFAVSLARIPQLAGALVAVSILGAIDAATGAGGEQELDVATRIVLADRPPLVLRQRFDGGNAATEAAIQLLAVVGFLANNELAEVEVASIEIEVQQRRGRRSTRVTAVHPDRRVVPPGATVALSVELDPYQGSPRRERFEIDLPADLEDGPYFLLVGDGTSLDAARMELEKFAPARIEQALDFLGGLHSREQLGVLGVAAAPGLAVGGEAMTRLPGSIREIWSAGPKSGAKELRTAVRQVVVKSLDVPLEGLVRVDLEIRARGRR
jgi:hypothetical protein